MAIQNEVERAGREWQWLDLAASDDADSEWLEPTASDRDVRRMTFDGNRKRRERGRRG